MAKLFAGSQSALLFPLSHASLSGRGPGLVECRRTAVSSRYHPAVFSIAKSANQFLLSPTLSHHTYLRKGSSVIPVTRASSLDVEVPGEKAELKPDVNGGGGDLGSGNDGNGGGGGGNGSNDNSGKNGDEGSDDADAKQNKALLMSQKFTLAYAALIGFGGFMGYLKSGSQKSLASGGLSALLLFYVYSELPKRPVFASSLGLGLSAGLLVVMGSRFKKSGKVFPAGVVSLVSLIMTGGYIHGIMKTSH